jgi:P-type Ca2+ transporter type 2C
VPALARTSPVADAAARAPDDGRAGAWHALPAEAVLQALQTSSELGLTSTAAAQRLTTHGPNVLAEPRRRGWRRTLLAQFTDVMVLVLIGAAVIAGAIGELQDVVAIVAIVVLNAVLGFVQEFRAERAMAALNVLATPTARARRDGRVVTIPAAQLAPGDAVALEAGNLVPADLRLVQLSRLEIAEAALTGEAYPVGKTTEALGDADTPLADRRNMAYKGTTVTYGHGVGIVVATGMNTELGHIAALLSDAEETQTPLQRRLARFGRVLSVGIVAICAVVFLTGLLRGEPLVLMFMTALSLAVAAIPEALPAVVTVSLALGARRLARQNALIRRLPAVETLGSVTCICSDKTGTLTQNAMRVEVMEVSGDEAESLLLEALAVSNDVVVDPDGRSQGDPTELALVRAAAELGSEKADIERRSPRVSEVPFSSERSRMTTVHRRADEFIAFTKGAPERVLEHCAKSLTSHGTQELDVDGALAASHRLARSGLRVLAFAVRKMRVLPDDVEDIEDDQAFIGLVGLLDPPRDEAAEAVALCQSAGIRVIMITGDHPDTAHVIARRTGIARPDDPVINGREIAKMSAQELASRVGDARVYARVAPEDKLRIVRALQARGEFVAMTGDGVNDAPALRRAEIGIAMGRSGTDVAREAADMVLLDDNFATIVTAVRGGRRIYDNLRKFIRFVMTGNASEIWTLLLAPFFGLPLPLLPIHILWVNLVTDGLPGLALAAEPEERDVMRRPPRPPNEGIFARGLWVHTLWVGLLIGAITLGVATWAYRSGKPHWQTMTFTVLTLTQMAYVLAIRSERESLVRIGLFTNRPLLAAVTLTFGLQLLVIYVPALGSVFKTAPLSVAELAVCVGAASLALVAVEVEKWILRSRVSAA